jgi:hypothetical protein
MIAYGFQRKGEAGPGEGGGGVGWGVVSADIQSAYLHSCCAPLSRYSDKKDLMT